MNINLGAPYEAIIQRFINREYAGNQTEVIRQALLAYDKMAEEEESILVHKAVEIEKEENQSGKIRMKTLEELKKKYGI